MIEPTKVGDTLYVRIRPRYTSLAGAFRMTTYMLTPATSRAKIGFAYVTQEAARQAATGQGWKVLG